MELEERLAELERQHSDGSLSEIGYNVRRNVLITRSDELARRRAAATVVAPRPAIPPPRQVASRRGRRLEPDGRDQGAPPSRQARLAGRRWTPFTTRPAVLLAAAILVGAAVFVAYRAATAGATQSPTAAQPQGGTTASSATAKPSQSAAAASAPAAPATVIDVTQATPGGGSVTLVSYADHFSSASPLNNPLPPGGFYAAVELKVCAGAAATIVSPFQFVLVEPDQTQVDIATGPTVGKQPQLSLDQLPPGGCVNGWLSYGVASRPAALDDSGDSLTWSIPG